MFHSPLRRDRFYWILMDRVSPERPEPTIEWEKDTHTNSLDSTQLCHDSC
jgi:hypothetical protein